jgi:hypothetical protein
MAAKRPGYREAVEWIAREDEPAEMNAEAVSGLVSVALVADLFGKEQIEVARAVIRFRRTHKDQMP